VEKAAVVIKISHLTCNGVKYVLNFISGRFHGKLHSRSFPELSEKQPIRQLSDNAQPTVTVKMGQNNKQPVASTKYIY
jgi:hypothetical protein